MIEEDAGCSEHAEQMSASTQYVKEGIYLKAKSKSNPNCYQRITSPTPSIAIRRRLYIFFAASSLEFHANRLRREFARSCDTSVAFKSQDYNVLPILVPRGSAADSCLLHCVPVLLLLFHVHLTFLLVCFLAGLISAAAQVHAFMVLDIDFSTSFALSLCLSVLRLQAFCMADVR